MTNRKPWSKADDLYIIDNAGMVPVAGMAAYLHRTQGAVMARAHVLRERGELDMTLRCYVPRTWECPECHRMRSRFHRSGVCQVCRLEELVSSHKDSAFELWRNLDPDYQSRTLAGSPHADADHGEILTFVDSEAPKMPNIFGMSRYMALKALDDYRIAEESHRIAVLKRQIGALKGRETRWRRHQKK